MITTIIFDLGETYINGVYGLENRLAPILKMPAARVREGIQGKDLHVFLQGKISEDEYWARVIRDYKWNTDVATAKAALRDNMDEIKGSRKIIEAMKAKGFKLGILSIHGKEWIEYCENRFGYHKFFDSVEYSFEAGISKPDKRAYQRILKKLKAKPEECLFIDDQPKNLPPAESLGIKTILFQNPAQLESDLAALGINLKD